jgi:hypothetical protein
VYLSFGFRNLFFLWLSDVGTDLKSMYLADSESSSIRRVDMTTGGSKLLAGGDPTFSDNLFQVLFEGDSFANDAVEITAWGWSH